MESDPARRAGVSGDPRNQPGGPADTSARIPRVRGRSFYSKAIHPTGNVSKLHFVQPAVAGWHALGRHGAAGLDEARHARG